MVTLDDSRADPSDDVIVNLATSLVGVLLLFPVAFRRPAALVYAVVPLVTGLGLALVFGALALGRLNSLTSASGALLIGLGIDFIIVCYGRYVEERQSGADHLAAAGGGRRPDRGRGAARRRHHRRDLLRLPGHRLPRPVGARAC